jgi:putative oxidoreductase
MTSRFQHNLENIMNSIQTAMAPIGRSLLALIFVVSGFGKIANYAGTQSYMETMGVPGMLLPLVIALEIIGGLAIILGWQTRIVAFLLAGFTLLSALIFHNNLGDQMQMIQFLKNLALTGAFLLLVAVGPGPVAVDNRSAR